MKLTTLILVTLLTCSSCSPGSDYQPRNGDIIFHTSQSPQSLAIQKATHPPYSHMGIVYLKDKQAYVFEAVEPVELTPLVQWIARGEHGEFAVKRLRDADELFGAAALARMHEEGETFRGKHYDPFFEWSDERIYCSELVWKIYQRALGIEIGVLQTLRDFDLSDPLVQAKLEERYGDNIPLDMKVISPAAMFDSDFLVTVDLGP